MIYGISSQFGFTGAAQVESGFAYFSGILCVSPTKFGDTDERQTEVRSSDRSRRSRGTDARSSRHVAAHDVQAEWAPVGGGRSVRSVAEDEGVEPLTVSDHPGFRDRLPAYLAASSTQFSVTRMMRIWCQACGLEPTSDAYKATASPSKLARQNASSWLSCSRPLLRHSNQFDASGPVALDSENGRDGQAQEAIWPNELQASEAVRTRWYPLGQGVLVCCEGALGRLASPYSTSDMTPVDGVPALMLKVHGRDRTGLASSQHTSSDADQTGK